MTASGRLSRGFYADKPCYWTYCHVTVTPDGLVQPCCNRPVAGGYGSARELPLAELVAGERARAFLEVAATAPGRIPECDGCEMKLRVNHWIHARLGPQGSASEVSRT